MSNSFQKMLAVSGGLAGVAFVAMATAPAGWFLAGSKPANYETGVDQKVIFNGHPSANLKAKTDADGFGTLMQSISATEYAGKRVRFSAFVKAEGVTRWSGLWLRIDGPRRPQNSYPEMMGFDNMQDRAIKGTTSWQKYEVVLDVNEKAAGIAYGILLDGPGEVLLNSANFEVVGLGVPTTGKSMTSMPDGPKNLSFDK